MTDIHRAGVSGTSTIRNTPNERNGRLEDDIVLWNTERVANKGVVVLGILLAVRYGLLRAGALIHIRVFDVVPKWPWMPESLLFVVDILSSFLVSDSVRGNRRGQFGPSL